MTVKVQPKKIVAKKTAPKVAIQVGASGFTPTGKVQLKVGGKTYSGTLKGGKVTIKLARQKKAGTVRATVTYLGDANTNSTSAKVKVKVVKAKAKAKGKKR